LQKSKLDPPLVLLGLLAAGLARCAHTEEARLFRITGPAATVITSVSSARDHLDQRGGSWDEFSFFCRVAFRLNSFPDFGDGDDGFRCVRGL